MVLLKTKGRLIQIILLLTNYKEQQIDVDKITLPIRTNSSVIRIQECKTY